MKTLKQFQESVMEEFEKFIEPKKFCGGDHCSGLWNLECDDVNHNDGRQLVTKTKSINFIQSALSRQASLFREAVGEMYDVEWAKNDLGKTDLLARNQERQRLLDFLNEK